MISRRNIRIKVMQTLYTYSSSEQQITKEQALRLLDKKLDESRQLFVFLVYFLTEVARYAETDARQRASRHITTEEDLNVNTKIAGNELLWKILELPSYQTALQETKPSLKETGEWVKKMYLQLVQSEAYQEYVAAPARDKKQERAIIEFIFTDLMLPNEDFLAEVIEENYMHWDDDGEMMSLLMMNFLSKPHTYDFQQFIGKEKNAFARDLLISVIDKEAMCNELIHAKLQNWDPERTALLDMIMMRMGICEFLYFETIPPKVTINEYIDLAKQYSTPQSGHFVNGILDSIHKELAQAGKLVKTSFKK